MMHPFTYESAATVQNAARAIEGGALPLAGGTDIIPLLKCEVREVSMLTGLGNIPALRVTEHRADGFFIGAMAQLCELAESEEISAAYPALAESARAVASPQIRSVGTIGGNVMQDRRCLYFNQSWEWRQSFARCFKTGGSVCHQAPASPKCRAPYYSDVATALCAYGAEAEIHENGAVKRIPVMELCTRHAEKNATSQPDGLLVTGFYLPVEEGAHSVFIKESVRASLDFPTFNAAGYAVKKDGAWSVRLVVGAVNSTPVELVKTQELLSQGKPLAEVKEAALKEIGENAVLVREAAISIKVKRASYQGIFPVLSMLMQCMG